MKRIFISSVQREFARERRLLKRYIAKNPAYRRLFDTFVFEEDAVAADRRADEVYLDELAKCQIYIGLIGNQYGFQDADGISPTEREYDEATRLGLPRLIFVLGRDGASRQDKEAAFLRKISANLIRAKCDDPGELLLEIYASLDGLLMEQGAYRMGPFDASVCDGASLDDIDEEKVAWFVRRARRLRNADIDEGMPVRSILNHLKLIAGDAGEITNAAILLFGKRPQRFHTIAHTSLPKREGRAAGLRDPVVNDSKSDFTVTIYRPLIAKVKGEHGIANKPQIMKVKDADIIAVIQKYPELSISDLANKLQITGQMMRYRMDLLRQFGILRREGARRNGRWVITAAFQGCGADGDVLVNEQMPVDPELELKIQKLADERGVPASIVVSQIVEEELSKGNAKNG